MATNITLAANDFALTITGDRPDLGPTYERLDGWYGVSDVDLGFVKRPGAAGAFAPRQSYPGEKIISVEGKFFGVSRGESLAMREQLAALYNEGREVTMTVTDDLRATTRKVLVRAVGIPWTIHPDFAFTIDVAAADPRRYGPTAVVGTGLAVAGGGLPLPLVTPVDFGVAGSTGRVVTVNGGNTETASTYVISGGDMPDGFVLVNVETGQRITYVGPVANGAPVTIETATRGAFINGTANASRYLSNPEWWTVPPRSSRTIQLLARGAVTGSPRVDVYTAPAYY